MEVMRSEEIDLTLDDDSQSSHCDRKSESDIDVEKDEIVSSKQERNFQISKNNMMELEDIEEQKDSEEIDVVETEPDEIKRNDLNLSSTTDEYEITKLIKYEEKLSDNLYVYLYSCGPAQQFKQKIIRPINCHACRFTTFNLDDMKSHIISKIHKSNVLNILSEKRYQTVYNLYDNSPKEFKIMICMFGGENIPKVHEENKNRLVYFCRSTNRLKLQKIVLNITKKDILNDINKSKPLFGLEYCIKFTNNYSYFCVLCNSHIMKDPLLHFAGKSHINNFIVRHFLLTRNKIATFLKNELCDTNNNELIEEIIFEIYKTLEKKNKLQKINTIEQKMFYCFRNHFVKIVCNHFHYRDEHVSQTEIISIVKEYIKKRKDIKEELCEYQCDHNNELVVINEDVRKNLENNFLDLVKQKDDIIEGSTIVDSTKKKICEDVTIISGKSSTQNGKKSTESLECEINEKSSYIMNAEKDFLKLKIISDLEVLSDPIPNDDAFVYWKKATFSLEYITRYKYYDNGQEVSKFKCTLCNKFVTKLIVCHATSRKHRMHYISKHFPILESYLKGCLSEMNYNNEKQEIIIGQMIAEVCQRLKKRSNKCFNQFFRISFKKFPKKKFINTYIKKCGSNKEHYDDRFFISVYKEKGEREMFLKDLLKRFLNSHNDDSTTLTFKRKTSDNLIINNDDTKRTKTNDCTLITPITLISVLKLIEEHSDLKEVKFEADRLLKHAELIERANGNITGLMQSVEYLYFFKDTMETLKGIVLNSDTSISEERMKSINKILDNCTLLIESMEETVLDLEDDDEPIFISSTNANDSLKILPNPFNSKFKKPNTITKANQQQILQSNYQSNNRNIVNKEIRVNNRNIGQSYMNINRPNSSSILAMNTNVNRYNNNNPVLNVTTYRETTQMNMSIPIMGSTVNNQNSFRNVFANNQQNHNQRFQNANLSQQHVNFSKAFTSYASRASNVQQSTSTGPQPPAAITQQSVRARILSPRAIPIVLSNAATQSSAQNSILNTRLNYRAPHPPSLSSFQHVSYSNNNHHVHNFNMNNTLSINQRFQTIRTPFSLNSSFPGAYTNNRNLFAGRTNF